MRARHLFGQKAKANDTIQIHNYTQENGGNSKATGCTILFCTALKKLWEPKQVRGCQGPGAGGGVTSKAAFGG